MSPGEGPDQLTTLARFTSREALTYYILVLPAVVEVAVFTFATASTPGDIVSLDSSYGTAAGAVVQLLPLLFMAASAYAIFSLRPSLLATLLVASFFIAISVANGIYFFGVALNLSAGVMTVIAAAFLALVSFSYARAIRLMGERKPLTESSGPLGYGVASVGLEVAFPLGAAVALVLLVQATVGAIGVEASSLPQPLSTLSTLYVQSRIGLVFTTLLVAGAFIWAIRQFVEPALLYYTLTPADAVKELLSEIEPTTKSVRKISGYRPSSGLSWCVLTAAYAVGVALALSYLVPHDLLVRDLSAAFSLRPSSPSKTELLLLNAFKDGLVRADILFAQSQDYVREFIRLLWG